MGKPFLSRHFFLLLLGAVLLLLALRAPGPAAVEVCTQPAPARETGGTQLLWESLSHQFLTSVQY